MCLNYFHFSFLVTFWLTIFHILIAVAYGYDDPPTIVSPDEITLEAGSNYLIECHGNSKMTWTTPKVPLYYEELTTFTTENIEMNGTEEYRMKSLLIIQNISFPFTGYYTCGYCDLSFRNDFHKIESAPVHIAVKDEGHLSVSNLQVLTVEQSNIIPCIPTFYDVRVTVSFNSCGNKPFMLSSQTPSFDFNYKVGFTLTKITCLGAIKCKYDWNGRSSTKYVVFTKQDNKRLSILPNTSRKIINKGSELKLECVTTLTDICIYWLMPKSLSQDVYTYCNDSNVSCGNAYPFARHGIGCRTNTVLYISTAWKNNSATYTCITYGLEATYAKSIEIQVVDSIKDLTQIQPLNGICSVTAKLEDYTAVNFSVSFTASSHVEIEWFDQNRNKIHISSNDSRKYSIVNLQDQSQVTIRNLSLEDIGKYTVIGSYGNTHAMYTFNLNVLTKPTIALKPKDSHYYFYNSSFKWFVRVSGNPTPTLYCYFLTNECKMNCTKSFANKMRVIKNTKYSNYIQIQFSAIKDHGYIRCIAINSLSAVYDTAPVILTDLKEKIGMTLLSVPPPKRVNTNTFTMSTFEYENVKLICAVSLYEYDRNLTWALNGSILKNTSKIALTEIATKFSMQLVLTIQNVSCAKNDVYTCNAKTKSNGTINEQHLIANVIHTTQPRFVNKHYHEIITDNKEFAGNLDLLCKAEGVPKPQIIWYRNGKKWNFTSKKDNDDILHIVQRTNYTCTATNLRGSINRQFFVTGSSNHWAHFFLLCMFTSSVLVIFILTMWVSFRFLNTRLIRRRNQKRNKYKAYETELNEDMNYWI